MSAPAALGLFGTCCESARQTLLRLRHHRVWTFVLVGTVVMAAVAWLVGSRVGELENGRSVYCPLAWWLQASVVMPWLTLYLGVQALHGGLEDRTFQYLFLRPVARVALLLGNWLAVTAVGALVGVFGSLALFVGLAGRADLWPDGVDWSLCFLFARTCAIGAVAYAAAAMFFSAWFRRPLVWAAFFVVGLQQVTANLPTSAGLRRATITDPLRRLLLDGLEPDARLAERLWPAEQFRPEMIGSPWQDLAWFTAIALVLAAWAYQRTEYDSRLRD
jgi:hypothetical protein